jgi:hypothetical protein
MIVFDFASLVWSIFPEKRCEQIVFKALARAMYSLEHSDPPEDAHHETCDPNIESKTNITTGTFETNPF